MNFSEFVERVVEEIKDYLPEEYAEADLQIVDCAKENINYKGLNIHKSDERITPTLNLDAFYEAYEETGDFEEILEKIAELRIETDKNKPLINYEDITKWENVKNKVVPALMNLDLNEELLKNLVHKKLGDMAIFYKIVFDINDGVGTTKVTHKILEMWGITGKELYEQAIANLELYPAKFLSYEDFMREIMEIENPPQINSGFLIIGDDDRGASGAGNVLNSKNCDKVAKYFGCKYTRMFLINKKVAGRTERTLKHYQDELKRFFSEVQKSPLEITADDIKLYLAMKEVQRGVSKATQQNTFRVLSSFFKWMIKEEYLLKNPMNKVDNIKIPKIKKHAFSEMEVELLRNRITDVRDKAILEVLLSTWCRVTELEGMNRTDIDGDHLEVLGKGQKARTVYLNARALVAIEEYLKTRTDKNTALFVTKDKPHARLLKSQIEKSLREYGKDCGIDKCHPHRFRRTGATMALRRGMPIEKVSKILGHESIDTTQIYLDINEQELASAHKKYV